MQPGGTHVTAAMGSLPSHPGAIAWMDDPDDPQGAGQWGTPNQLSLPIGDRGLLLADGLFETLLVEQGRAHLLTQHLERWRISAAELGLPRPPGRQRVIALLGEALTLSGNTDGALRLNWSRGTGATRGLDLPSAAETALRPRFWLEFRPHQPVFAPLRVILSRQERRNAHSRVSRCKTFGYGASVQARREAHAAGADDALLLSTAGGLCCGTAANLLMVDADGTWWTPPQTSGCLPGVMRGRALALGLALERTLQPQELGGAVLLNSLGCRPILSLDGRPLPVTPDAEALFRSLLAGP